MNEQSVDTAYYVPEEEQSISLLQMFEIVKKRIVLIVVLTLVALVAAIGYLLFLKTPSYSASATAIVRPMSSASSIQELLSDNSKNITTELQVMSAASTLQSALETLDLSLYRGHDGVPYSDKELSAEQMIRDKKVSVSVTSNTNVVTFTVNDSNPQFCADYANAIVSVSSNILRKMSRSSKYSQKELIESQIISTQELLDVADEELSKYREENGVIQTAQKISLLTKRIASFQLMMEPLRLELEECGSVVSSLYSESMPSVSSIESDASVLSIVDGYEQAVTELLMYSSMDSSKTNLYDMVYVSLDGSKMDVSTTADSLSSIPMDASAQASNPWGSSRMTSIQNSLVSKENDLYDLYDIVFAMCREGGGDYAHAVVDYIAIKARLTALERMESNYSDDFAEYSALERKLSQLERNVSTYESLILSLKTSLDNTETMVEAVDTQNFTIVSDASVPDKPESQKKAMTLAVAFVLGAGCGVLLAFVLEMADSSVKSEDTIKSILGRSTPSLGWTYYLKDISKTKADYPELVVKNAPYSVFSEKYRTIANNILNAASPNAKVFSINSVEDCEGRTSTICNVAVCYAMAGKKVVVVDADLSHPAVARFFGVDASKKGFANIMAGDAKVSDCLVAPVKSLPSLYVVPSGVAKDGSIGLMYSQAAFEKAIADLRDDFDCVLVDFPALSHCPDFTCLSKCMDGYVLNVRAGVESRSSLISFNAGRGFIAVPLMGYIYYGVIPENQSAYGNLGFYGAKGWKDGDSMYHVGKGSYRRLYEKDLKDRD